MPKNKKIIVGVVLGVVLLVGSLVGGVVLAADNGEDGNTGARDAMWEKVGELYLEKTGTSLDQEALKESFKETMGDLRENARQLREEARQNSGDGDVGTVRQLPSMQDRLQKMVEEGKITQDQADEYLQWWNARPDVEFGLPFRGHRGPCIPPSE
jgi:cytochrome c556